MKSDNLATQIKQSYIARASFLNMGSFTHVSTGKARVALINKLSDGYIKATADHDEDLRDQYISALMLLFWGEVSKMAEKCRTVPGYTFVDYISKLYECIEVAMKYHAWQSGKTTAEACIRSTIATRGVAATIQQSNLFSTKANVGTTSLETPLKSDEKLTVADTIADNAEDVLENKMEEDLIIQYMLNKRKPVEGIILDVIFNNDVYRVTKSYKNATFEDGTAYKKASISTELQPSKIVKIIDNLQQDYLDNFNKKYNVRLAETSAAFDRLKSADHSKLYSMIKNTVAYAKCM